MRAFFGRALRRWRLGYPNSRTQVSSEQGDTLVEVLLAIVVVGMAGVALLAGFATSISSSAEHRNLASLDSSIRIAANKAIADVQQEAQAATNTSNDPFSCSGTLPLTFANLTGPFQVTYPNPLYWQNGSGFVSGCIVGAPQQYKLTISSTKANYSTSVETVITDPGAPLPPNGSATPFQLAWDQEPTGGNVDTPITPQPEVEVENSSDAIISSDFSSVTLQVLSAPPGGTLSNTCSGVESYGIVQFSDCSMSAPGSYTIQAVDSTPGVTPTAPPDTFTVLPNAAAKLAFTTNAVSGSASSSATLGQITVQEQDGFGNPVAPTTPLTVTLGSSSAGGIFSAASGGTAITSVTIPTTPSASASFWYGDTKAGTPTITAAATGLVSGTQQEKIAAGSGSQLAITSNAFTAPVSSSATNPFTVTLEDAFGNPTTSGTTTKVNLSTTDTGTGKFSATSGGATVTSVNLMANTQSVTAFYGDTKAGTPTITAAATGLTPSGTQQETILSSGPTKLVFTAGPVTGSTAANAALGPITVTEETAGGTPTTVAETITLTSNSTGTYIFSTTQGATTPTGTTTVTIPNGQSSVTFYYGDTKVGTPNINAAAAGLTSATQQETITAGAPSKLVFTTGAKSGPASNSANLGPITVQEQDAYGNVTSTATATSVNLSSTSPGGTFAASAGGTAFTSVSIPANTSTATFYYGDTKAGTPTITAAATGLTSGTQQETIKALAGTNLAITSTAFTAAASASAVDPFVVTLEDSYGNPATSATAITVNLSTTSGVGKFAAASGGATVTSVTLPANASSVTVFYGDTAPGSPAITVTATGLAPATQQETITAGAPSKLVFTTGAKTGSASNSANLGPITVQEQDAYGNVTSTATATSVNLSSTSPGGTFAASTGGTAFTSVSIPANTSTATFYYGDTKAGTPTITAAATGLTSGTQQETIAALSGTNLGVSVFSDPASASATDAFTVALTDIYGNPTKIGTATVVTLSTNSATGIIAAASGGAAVASVTLPANTSSVTAYYGDTKAGTPTITAAATGLTSGTQQETITAAAAHTIAVTSGSPQSATVNSAFANPLVATVTDTFGNPVSGAVVTFTAPTGTGVASGTFASTSNNVATATTVANGAATSSTFTANTTSGGPYNVTASTTGTNTVNFALTNTAGAPHTIGITPAPTSVAASSSTNATLGLQLEDQYGNPTTNTTGSTIVVTLNSSSTQGFFATSSGATGSATLAVNFTTGQSTATAYYGDTKAGTPTITAAATGLTSGTQQETIKALSGTMLVITSGSFNVPASASATNAFATTLEDSFSNPTTSASAITVNLSSTSSGAKFAAASGGAAVASVTLPANTSSVTAYYGDTKAGTPTITAAATGLTSGTQQETITAAAAHTIAVTSGSPQSATVNSAFANPLVATVTDTFGNPVSGAVVTFTAPTGTGVASGTFASTSNNVATATTVANGAATSSTFTANTTSGGPYNVTASTTGTNTVNFALTNTAGAPHTIGITPAPTSVAASSSTNATLGLQLEDQYGNPTTNTTGSTIVVTLNSSSTQGFFATSSGATGSATLAVNFTTGQSTATAYYGDTKAGTPTITAAATGLTSGTQQETITAAAAHTIAVTSGSPQSATVNSAFANPLVATVTDTFGNPVSGAVVTFTAPTGTGVASGTFASTSNNVATATTVANGAATSSTFTANTTSGGPYNVTASTTGTNTVNFALTNTAGAPHTIGITPAPTSVAASSSTNATLGLQLEDQYGNPTTNTTGSTIVVTLNSSSTQGFFATSSGATGSATLAVNFTTGQSTATAYYGDTKAGTPTITAAATGLTSGTQQETITAAAAHTIAVTSGSPQSATVNSAFANPLVATVTDTFGNPVSGAVVTFTAPTGTGVASGTFASTSNNVATATTVANGAATSSTFTANTTSGGPYNITASTTGTNTVNFALTNTAKAAATSVASATGTTGTSDMTGAFTTINGSTYVIVAYESSSNTASTPTFTITGGETPTLVTGSANNFSAQADCGSAANDCNEWAWTFNANSATSQTVKITFNGTPTYTAIDVLQLSGNDTVTPVVAAATSIAAGCPHNHCSTNTSTATANLATATTNGDVSLEIVGSDNNEGSGTLTWAPAVGVTKAFQNGTATGSLGVYVTSPAVQDESTSSAGWGGNRDWGTISLEINHG